MRAVEDANDAAVNVFSSDRSRQTVKPGVAGDATLVAGTCLGSA